MESRKVYMVYEYDDVCRCFWCDYFLYREFAEQYFEEIPHSDKDIKVLILTETEFNMLDFKDKEVLDTELGKELYL